MSLFSKLLLFSVAVICSCTKDKQTFPERIESKSEGPLLYKLNRYPLGDHLYIMTDLKSNTITNEKDEEVFSNNQNKVTILHKEGNKIKEIDESLFESSNSGISILFTPEKIFIRFNEDSKIGHIER